jgi:hypothetical protein
MEAHSASILAQETVPVPPSLSIIGNCREPFFSAFVLKELGKERVSIFLLLHGSPRGGELPWGYFTRFLSRVSFEIS